jgi:hypothetical protein
MLCISALAEAGLLTATMLASLRLVICMDTAALSCPGAVALAQAEFTVTSPAWDCPAIKHNIIAR